MQLRSQIANFLPFVLNMHLLQFIAPHYGPRSLSLISRLFDAVNCVALFFKGFNVVLLLFVAPKAIYELCRSEGARGTKNCFLVNIYFHYSDSRGNGNNEDEDDCVLFFFFLVLFREIGSVWTSLRCELLFGCFLPVNLVMGRSNSLHKIWCPMSTRKMDCTWQTQFIGLCGSQLAKNYFS